jgi:hypothetical protein
MKYFIAVLINFVLLTNFVVCDVILWDPPKDIVLQKCVKITNLDDYPNIAFIVFIEHINLGVHYSYLIESNTCLKQISAQEKLTIYAFKKDYLKNKNIVSTDWSKEKNCSKSNINIEPIELTIREGDPIEGFEEHFKIVGFKDNTIVMYKWKDVKVYGFWTKNQVTKYEFNGDRNGLSQDIK